MPDKSDNKTKRQVKNPETFRERAVKANEAPDKPSKANRVKSGVGKPLGKIFRPVGRALAKLVKIQPFKTIALVVAPPYVRNSWAELKLVTWPTRHQSFRLTFAVLVFAVIFGITIAGVDFVLDKVFREIILDIK